MKTSNIILLTAGIIILASIQAFLFHAKNVIEGAEDCMTQRIESESVTVTRVGVSDFTSISAESTLDISLVRGDDYSVELKTATNSSNNEVMFEKKGSTLFIRNKNNRFLYSPRVTITMPSVEKIALNGVSSLSFSEFDINELGIRTEGVVSVSGNNSTIQNLMFSGNGLLRLDLSDVPVKNAEIRHEGLYLVELLMNGGVLAGKITGMGSLNWRGDVSENRIKVESPGKIIHIN